MEFLGLSGDQIRIESSHAVVLDVHGSLLAIMTTIIIIMILLLLLFLFVVSHHRETHGSGASYHKELAKELGSFLEKVIKVCVIL